MAKAQFYRVPRGEWSKECCFIIAGGPSVLDHDLEQLRGRRVIVINSSIHAAPWADFCYFGDWRWWNEDENKAAVVSFGGRVVTVSRLPKDSKVLVCRNGKPPGLSQEPDCLVQKWTSLTAATNLAVHLLAPGGTIVWIGADGRAAADGRVWHHAPHRWGPKPERYDRHRAELATMAEPLRRMGVTLLIAGPSAYGDLWPVVSLQDALQERRAA